MGLGLSPLLGGLLGGAVTVSCGFLQTWLDRGRELQSQDEKNLFEPKILFTENTPYFPKVDTYSESFKRISRATATTKTINNHKKALRDRIFPLIAAQDIGDISQDWFSRMIGEIKQQSDGKILAFSDQVIKSLEEVKAHLLPFDSFQSQIDRCLETPKNIEFVRDLIRHVEQHPDIRSDPFQKACSSLTQWLQFLQEKEHFSSVDIEKEEGKKQLIQIELLRLLPHNLYIELLDFFILRQPPTLGMLDIEVAEQELTDTDRQLLEAKEQLINWQKQLEQASQDLNEANQALETAGPTIRLDFSMFRKDIAGRVKHIEQVTSKFKPQEVIAASRLIQTARANRSGIFANLQALQTYVNNAIRMTSNDHTFYASLEQIQKDLADLDEGQSSFSLSKIEKKLKQIQSYIEQFKGISTKATLQQSLKFTQQSLNNALNLLHQAKEILQKQQTLMDEAIFWLEEASAFIEQIETDHTRSVTASETYSTASATSDIFQRELFQALTPHKESLERLLKTIQDHQQNWNQTLNHLQDQGGMDFYTPPESQEPDHYELLASPETAKMVLPFEDIPQKRRVNAYMLCHFVLGILSSLPFSQMLWEQRPHFVSLTSFICITLSFAFFKGIGNARRKVGLVCTTMSTVAVLAIAIFSLTQEKEEERIFAAAIQSIAAFACFILSFHLKIKPPRREEFAPFNAYPPQIPETPTPYDSAQSRRTVASDIDDLERRVSSASWLTRHMRSGSGRSTHPLLDADGAIDAFVD